MPYVAAGVVKTGGAALIGQGRGAFAYPDSVRDILQTGKMDPAKCCVACSACTQIMRDGASDRLRGAGQRDLRAAIPPGTPLRHGPAAGGGPALPGVRAAHLRPWVPGGIDVPRFLKAFADGDIKTAYAVLRGVQRPAGDVRPDVCPKQEQCEGGCVEKIFCEHPVAIGDIQLVTARTARLQGLTGVRLPAKRVGKHVAVVGGGPAGLACAIKLLEAGHAVTIYENGQRLGGTPGSLIPDRALRRRAKRRSTPFWRRQWRPGGCEIRFGRGIWAETWPFPLCGPSMRRLPGHGTGRVGTSLGGVPGVVDALGFLARVKRGELTGHQGRVAVMGGGNTAVDAAVTAKRLGAGDVYLVYRRSYLQMPAWEEDRDVLLKSGVDPLFLTQPCGYETADGKLTGLRVARTELGPADASGRRRPQTVPAARACFP